jgi:hypothetical protein
MRTSPQKSPQSISVAESLLGQIDWQDGTTGFCPCPGEHLHTHKSGKRDCRVTLDGAPTIFCFHTSCVAFIEGKNRELRSALGKAEVGASIAPYRPTPQDLERQRQRDRDERLKARTEKSLKKILIDYRIDDRTFRTSSPTPLDCSPHNDWKLHLRLFPLDAIVWIGAVSDSGKPHHAKNFRPTSEWLAGEQPSGNFNCPSVFKNNSVSRSNENVIHRPYLVVESDVHTRENMLAIIQWLRSFLVLRAVIFTGGRSLHGWFEYPEPNAEKELRIILPALGCDPAMFKSSQPCRLAGAWRAEKRKWQSLLWLDLEGSEK